MVDNILLEGYITAKNKTDNFKVEFALEERARHVFNLIEKEKEFPTKSTLKICKEFLIDVEKWKMMSIKCRIGNAALNCERDIYVAFRGVLLKTTDKEKLLSIMNLSGFGSSVDINFQRRAKAASAVMRFFYPESWGVVDWRLMAILSECKKYSWDAASILADSERAESKELRSDFDIITEDMCIWLNQEYRSIVRQSQHFVRVADIDMALFEYSWLLWPK
ncbi:TPA: hypothetical protein ACPVXP_002791 [Vibrio parahaemolyticus]